MTLGLSHAPRARTTSPAHLYSTAPRVLSPRAHALFHDITTLNLADPQHLVAIGAIRRGHGLVDHRYTNRWSDTETTVPPITAGLENRTSTRPPVSPPTLPPATDHGTRPTSEQDHTPPPVRWYERMRRAVAAALPSPPGGWGALASAFLPRSWVPSWRAGRS